jgi:hypothetical protein
MFCGATRPIIEQSKICTPPFEPNIERGMVLNESKWTHHRTRKTMDVDVDNVVVNGVVVVVVVADDDIVVVGILFVLLVSMTIESFNSTCRGVLHRCINIGMVFTCCQGYR